MNSLNNADKSLVYPNLSM